MAAPIVFGSHLRGAVIASPDGDVYEELWADYSSFLLAEPTGGPPMPCADECSTGFVKVTWQQARLSGTLPTRKEGHCSSQLSWWFHATPTLPWITQRQFPQASCFSQLSWVLAGLRCTEMPSLLSLTTSPPHVDYGYSSLAEASLAMLHHLRCCIIKGGAFA